MEDREDRMLCSRSHHHALILIQAYASICSPALWPVILQLIASVFYHDALLSPTRSLGSCQRGPLSASHRVWQRKHRPAVPIPPTTLPFSWTGEGKRCSGLSLSTVHNTRSSSHCTLSPNALALGCTSTGPLSSPLQVLQSVNGAAPTEAFFCTR